MDDSNLRDLVDYPTENLGVELKEWIDLNDGLVRAKLARHLSALSNYGGGYVVIGFCDDGTPAPDRPANLTSYNHDVIAGIVKRYLEPHFHCDVVTVRSSSGEEYPVIRVPSHKSAPVCAKASGPHDSNGNPQGIVQGRYYLRLPGPASAPITTPDQWQSVIRRCVLSEREFIVDALSDLTTTIDSESKTSTNILSEFHQNGRERYRHLVQRSSESNWPVSLENHHYQLSYRIILAEPDEIPATNFIQKLSAANNDLKDIVWTGWSMFYPFARPEIQPIVEPETIDGKDTDVYVTSLLDEKFLATTLPDYWRITRAGLATIIRAYREDRNPEGDSPGTLFSPELLVREITEILGHALAMAKHLPHSEGIELIGSWHGLSGRTLTGRNGTWDYDGEKATANDRTVSGEWAIPRLQGAWLEIITELSNRILILFDRYQISTDQVNVMATRFRTL